MLFLWFIQPQIALHASCSGGLEWRTKNFECLLPQARSPVFVSIHFPFLNLICFTYFNSLFPLLELRWHFINRASVLHGQSFVLALPHFWGHHSNCLCLTLCLPSWWSAGLCMMSVKGALQIWAGLAPVKPQGRDFGPLYFSAPVLSPLLSHPTDRWSFGVYRWLHAQLPLGAAAAEHEDKAGNGWSHVHIPSQVSNRASHRWDKSESNNGGGCSLDCWTLLVLLLSIC